MYTESTTTTAVIVIAICIYIYLLFGPNQKVVPSSSPFILEPFSKAQFDEFIMQVKEYTVPSYGNVGEESEWGESGGHGERDGGNDFSFRESGSSSNEAASNSGGDDDFFFDPSGAAGQGAMGGEGRHSDNRKEELAPIVPSKDFYCLRSWVVMRSDLNYKYLWLHEKDSFWLSANAPFSTGLHHKAFEVIPVGGKCSEEGWVKLRAYDHKGYLALNGPRTNSDLTWVVEAKTEDDAIADQNADYHFLLEQGGYILNKGAMAFINVIGNPDYPVRGHGSDYFTDRVPARRESGALMSFLFVNGTDVEASAAHQVEEDTESHDEDKKLVSLIHGFPRSLEKRVIAFGLYGRNPKYTQGAIKNAELLSKYFPGWVCRFYTTSDVPADVITKLQNLGSEIEKIPDGLGYVAGMFYRFLVADDPHVDRYIIRDSDSRLNARDRIAVEEWILSKRKIHILRDHVNHCIPMNGGMWGGVKGAITNMRGLIDNWENLNEYGADLHFLEEGVYPEVKSVALEHDSYCCDKYPGARPFPSKRYPNYQHVGQVFDSVGEARLTDIDGFIRGVPVPSSCRKRAEWIYG